MPILKSIWTQKHHRRRPDVMSAFGGKADIRSQAARARRGARRIAANIAKLPELLKKP
jgi:hypothetical protein